MTRRHRRRAEGEQVDLVIPVHYEGAAALTSLLSRAGSPLTAGEVAAAFQRARAAGEERSAVIPTLFPQEPRFAGPEEASRLYGNLFALWEHSAAGDPVTPAAEPVEEAAAIRPAPPLPPRGAASGDALATDLVEAVWKHLAALEPRERQRLLDRFEGAQPDLVAWLDARPLGDGATVAARDLAFEAWAMFDVAFGERLEAAAFDDLRSAQDEPPALEASQPALAAYVSEALDLVEEEDPRLRSRGARPGRAGAGHRGGGAHGRAGAGAGGPLSGAGGRRRSPARGPATVRGAAPGTLPPPR